LPSTATEEMLVTRFCRFGGVVSVMLEAVTRANRRGAVIEMQSSWDAQNAINGLNLSDFDGRLVSVYKAAAAASGKTL
jgi:hypothetical protein